MRPCEKDAAIVVVDDRAGKIIENRARIEPLTEAARQYQIPIRSIRIFESQRDIAFICAETNSISIFYSVVTLLARSATSLPHAHVRPEGHRQNRLSGGKARTELVT